MTAHRPLHITAILGSVRKERFGDTVARWFVEEARNRDDIVVDLVDLADVPLTTVGPSRSPDQETSRALGALNEAISGADGYVVVTPEYNHSVPAALKNFIDWHLVEWRAKPVAFVSYGGLAGGLRAVEHLRLIFAELHAVTVRDTVSFHGGVEAFDDVGSPIDPKGARAAAETLLGGLTWWAWALRAARAEQPYAP